MGSHIGQGSSCRGKRRPVAHADVFVAVDERCPRPTWPDGFVPRVTRPCCGANNRLPCVPVGEGQLRGIEWSASSLCPLLWALRVVRHLPPCPLPTYDCPLLSRRAPTARRRRAYPQRRRALVRLWQSARPPDPAGRWHPAPPWPLLGPAVRHNWLRRCPPSRCRQPARCRLPSRCR